MVADWLLVMVPAVAGNVVEAAPAARVIDAGTPSNPLLLSSETTAPPLGAPLESVTVQVALALLARLVGPQDNELNTVAEVRDTVAAFELLV